MIGSGTTNASGNVAVTLSGSATFTSGTTYQCSASYIASSPGSAAIATASKSSTGFTLKGDASKEVQFICVGN